MKWTPGGKRISRLAPSAVYDVVIAPPEWLVGGLARIFQVTGGTRWSLAVIVFDGTTATKPESVTKPPDARVYVNQLPTG